MNTDRAGGIELTNTRGFSLLRIEMKKCERTQVHLNSNKKRLTNRSEIRFKQNSSDVFFSRKTAVYAFQTGWHEFYDSTYSTQTY